MLISPRNADQNIFVSDKTRYCDSFFSIPLRLSSYTPYPSSQSPMNVIIPPVSPIMNSFRISDWLRRTFSAFCQYLFAKIYIIFIKIVTGSFLIPVTILFFLSLMTLPFWYNFFVKFTDFANLSISRNSAIVIIKGYCAETALCAC